MSEIYNLYFDDLYLGDSPLLETNNMGNLGLNVKQVEKAKILKKNVSEKTFVLYDMEVIKQISKICLPKAFSSEFQVGYEAVRIELKKNNKIVNLIIPTCFYNFKQTVSSSTVDWMSDDLDEVVKNVMNTTDISKLNEIVTAFYSLKSLDYEVTISRGDFGSIHRHPGKCTFSSTDLRNDPKNPGIIYRKGTFNGVQIDSLIYIPGNDFNRTELFYSEARRVDIKQTEDGGVSGSFEEHLCTNIFYNRSGFEEVKEVIFDDLLNFTKTIEEEVKEVKYFYTSEDTEDEELIKKYEILNLFTENYHTTSFSPCIKNVIAENIEEKKISYYYQNYGKRNYSYNNSNVDDFLDNEECVAYLKATGIKESKLEKEHSDILESYFELLMKFKSLEKSTILVKVLDSNTNPKNDENDDGYIELEESEYLEIEHNEYVYNIHYSKLFDKLTS